MPMHIEPLNKGLVTSRDPSRLEPGELVLAQNARYRPRDPALYQVEGRKKDGSGGHGAVVPLTQIVNLQWDRDAFGTIPDGPSQLVYFVPGDGAAKSIPCLDDPGASAMNASAATSYPLTNVPLPSGPIESIALGGGAGTSFVLLSNSAEKIWVRRAAGAQRFDRFGMPPSSYYAAMPIVISSTSGGPGPFFPSGFYRYWITFYDSVTGDEGGIEDFNDVPTTISHAIGGGGTINGQILYVTKEAFDINKAVTRANKLRIYRTTSHNDPTISPFPFGYRIAEIDIIAFPTATINFNGIPTLAYEVYRDLAAGGISNTAILGQPLYDFVEIAVGTLVSYFSRNGQPPIATTGDVYDGSFVVNNTAVPRRINYSYSDRFKSFPSPFYLDIDGRDNDEVVAVRTLGRRLGVILKDSIWRVNWLPRETDPDFQRGRVLDIVGDDFGAVSRACVARFTLPGAGVVIAFVATSGGIYATDLDSIKELAPQVSFASVATPIALVNNPDEHRLEFYYLTKDRATPHVDVFYLHYHETQLNDGMPVVTGPIERPGGVAHVLAASTQTGKKVVITSDAYRNILYEGRGFADESLGVTRTFLMQTREIYAAGVGNEFATSHMRVHVRKSESGIADFALIMRSGPTVVAKVDPVEISERRFGSASAVVNAEFVDLLTAGTPSGAAMGLNYVGFEWDPLGPIQR